MARPMKVARTAPQPKSAPQRKKVTTRTAQQRRTQSSPIARAVTQRDVTKRTRRFVFVGLSTTCGLVIGLHLTVEECYEIVAGKFFNYVLALESILGVIFS